MFLNEALQWAVLVFLSIFVLGLTRQIGNLLMSTREQKARLEGPRLHQPVPLRVVTVSERELFADLMRGRGVPWCAILVMDERCAGCEEMLAELEEDGVPQQTPLMIVARASKPAHRARLERIADLVVVDDRRFKKTNVTITPFTMILDEEFNLVEKAMATHLAAVVGRWRREREDLAEAAPRAAAPAELQITRRPKP